MTRGAICAVIIDKIVIRSSWSLSDRRDGALERAVRNRGLYMGLIYIWTKELNILQKIFVSVYQYMG